MDNHLLLAAGNDYLAHLLDIRALSSGAAGALLLPACPHSSDVLLRAAAGIAALLQLTVKGATAPAPSRPPAGLSASAKGKEAAVSTAAGGGAASATLAQLKHPKVINAAYFSPITGRKILTTCQDNRLRVWDYLYTANQVRRRLPPPPPHLQPTPPAGAAACRSALTTPPCAAAAGAGPRDCAQPELQSLPHALQGGVGPKGPGRAPAGVRQVRPPAPPSDCDTPPPSFLAALQCTAACLTCRQDCSAPPVLR